MRSRGGETPPLRFLLNAARARGGVENLRFLQKNSVKSCHFVFSRMAAATNCRARATAGDGEKDPDVVPLHRATSEQRPFGGLKAVIDRATRDFAAAAPRPERLSPCGGNAGSATLRHIAENAKMTLTFRGRSPRGCVESDPNSASNRFDLFPETAAA